MALWQATPPSQLRSVYSQHRRGPAIAEVDFKERRSTRAEFQARALLLASDAGMQMENDEIRG